MKTKIFRIAFVMEDGRKIYYGYNRKFPFLTYEINGAYKFDLKCYGTKELLQAEVKRLKVYFFGNNDKIEPIIMI